MGVINTLLQKRSSHFPKATVGDFRGDGIGNLGEDITEGVLVFLRDYQRVLFPLSILLLPGLNTSVYFIFLGGLWIWSFHLMASKVFNGRNELSTLRRCLSNTDLGFKRIGQASFSAGSPQKHTQHSCIFSPALILEWVMVAVRQRDRRCCAPGWPWSCEHCPSSTPQLEQFSSHTNCADHPASSPWKDGQNPRGSHVLWGLQAPGQSRGWGTCPLALLMADLGSGIRQKGGPQSAPQPALCDRG